VSWAGGAANRTWDRGQPQPPARATNCERLEWHVRRYLADCRQFSGILSAKHHPTEDGAVKVIFHRGKAEADAIRTEFGRQVAAGPRPLLAAANG
jgi:hypothetical protein